MIAGQYIGFHNTRSLAYLYNRSSPFDNYFVTSALAVSYYKGGAYLGNASLSSCAQDLLLPGGSIWSQRCGNAGGLLGTGPDSYDATSQSGFYVSGSIQYFNIVNSVFFYVNQ